jgi:hypothetical protein
MGFSYDGNQEGHGLQLPVMTSGAITLLGWIKQTGTQAFASPAYIFSSTNNRSLAGFLTDGTGSIIYMYDNDTNTLQGSGYSLTIGQWVRIAMTWDGTTATYYVGSVGSPLTVSSVSSTAYHSAGSYSNAFLYFGQVNGGNWRWNGNISTFKVWNAALTQTEIETEFARGKPSKTTSLVGYWPMVNGSVTDYSNSGKDITSFDTSGTTTPGVGDDPPLRLYPTNAAAGYTPPTVRGTWTTTSVTGTRVVKSLSPIKQGTAATVAMTETNSTSGINIQWGRWISEPITNSQALAGTLDWVIGVVESTTNLNGFFAAHVFVTTGDTDTVRGTLLSNYPATALGTEFGTTAQGRNSATTPSLSSVTPQIGDRLVIEFGYEARNTITTGSPTPGATMNYGGTGTTDLSNGDSTVTTEPGWFQFSQGWPLFIGQPPPSIPKSGGAASGTAASGTKALGVDRSSPLEMRAGSNGVANGSPLSSATVNKPIGVVQGDLLLVAQVCDKDGSSSLLTAPTGWDLAYSNFVDGSSGSWGYVKIWTKIAGSSEPSTYTFGNSSSADCSVGIVAIASQNGLSPTLSVLDWFVAFTNGTDDISAVSVESTNNGMFLIVWAYGSTIDSTRSFSTPTGMTEEVDTNVSIAEWIGLAIDSQVLGPGTTTGLKESTSTGFATGYTNIVSIVFAPPQPVSVTYTKTGTSAVVGAGLGSKVVQNPVTSAKTGLGSLVRAASGTETVQHPITYTKTGLSNEVMAASGQQVFQHPTTYTKSGISVVVFADSGVQALQHPTTYTKNGLGNLSEASSGADTVQHPLTHAKAGTSSADHTASGTDLVVHALTYTKAGLGATIFAANGTETVTHALTYTKSGESANAFAASGIESILHTITYVKEGTGSTVLVVSGGSETQHATTYTKDGLSAFINTAQGLQEIDYPDLYVKEGIGSHGFVSSGTETVIHPTVTEKLGTSSNEFTASGTNTVQHAIVYTKSNTSAVGNTSQGIDEVTHPLVYVKVGASSVEFAALGDEEIDNLSIIYTKSGTSAVDFTASGIDTVATALRYEKSGSSAFIWTISGSEEVAGPGIITKAGKAAFAYTVKSIKTIQNVGSGWPPAIEAYQVDVYEVEVDEVKSQNPMDLFIDPQGPVLTYSIGEPVITYLVSVP